MFVMMASALMTLGFAPQSAMAFGSISGTVSSADGGAVAGAMIMVMGIDMHRGQRPFMGRAESIEDGSYEVTNVPNGRYIVSAMTRELGGARAEALVENDGNTPVDLVLRGGRGGGGGGEERPTGSLTIDVVPPDGVEPGVARVCLVPARMQMRGHRVRPINLETDADGHLEIETIPAGVWVVTAGIRGVGVGRERVTIVAERATEVTITLRGRH